MWLVANRRALEAKSLANCTSSACSLVEKCVLLRYKRKNFNVKNFNVKGKKKYRRLLEKKVNLLREVFSPASRTLEILYAQTNKKTLGVRNFLRYV